MVMNIESKAKVSPQVVQAILADDMVRRLADMQDMMRREEPIGELQNHPLISVTTQPQEIRLGEWLEATIWVNSDSSGNVQVSNGPRMYDTGKSYQGPGERLVLNNKRRSNRSLWFVSNSTATVRMVYQ